MASEAQDPTRTFRQQRLRILDRQQKLTDTQQKLRIGPGREEGDMGAGTGLRGTGAPEINSIY